MHGTGLTAQKQALTVRGPRRRLYVVLGLLFLGLGILGAILPLLPTTPFVLLASWFFARSSPAWQAWLEKTPLFGSLLRDWQAHRAVSPRAKLTAYVMIPGMIVLSAAGTDLPWRLTAVLCALGGLGLVIVWRLPVVIEHEDKTAAAATIVSDGRVDGAAIESR